MRTFPRTGRELMIDDRGVVVGEDYSCAATVVLDHACYEVNADQRPWPTSVTTHVLHPRTGPSTKKNNVQGAILRNCRLNAIYIPPTCHSRMPHPVTTTELPRDKTKLEAFKPLLKCCIGTNCFRPYFDPGRTSIKSMLRSSLHSKGNCQCSSESYMDPRPP